VEEAVEVTGEEERRVCDEEEGEGLKEAEVEGGEGEGSEDGSADDDVGMVLRCTLSSRKSPYCSKYKRALKSRRIASSGRKRNGSGVGRPAPAARLVEASRFIAGLLHNNTSRKKFVNKPPPNKKN